MRRLVKFLDLAPADRTCLVEAAGWLGLARLAILVLPFRWLAPRLGRHMALSPAEAAAPAAVLDRISWAVTTASRHLPWECKCLAQALAGKAMLQRRGVASTLYLGVGKEPAAGLQAHAWLRCGPRILTGAPGMSGFTVICTFAEEGKEP
jgi:hypothetical protein